MGSMASARIRTVVLARNSNPWTAWSRWASAPLVPVPVWSKASRTRAAACAWFVVNPVLSRTPAHQQAWTTKAIPGEELWLVDHPGDAAFAVNIAAAPATATHQATTTTEHCRPEHRLPQYRSLPVGDPVVLFTICDGSCSPNGRLGHRQPAPRSQTFASSQTRNWETGRYTRHTVLAKDLDRQEDFRLHDPRTDRRRPHSDRGLRPTIHRGRQALRPAHRPRRGMDTPTPRTHPDKRHHTLSRQGSQQLSE